MTITHIVMFSFKPEVDTEGVYDVCAQFLGLRNRCMHPETKKPYIQTIAGGKQNSPEGLNEGVTHVFVMTFAGEADRAYYLHDDPDHKAFQQLARPRLSKAQVVDFTNDSF